MTDALQRPFVETIGPFDDQIIATSLHAGHDLRPEIAAAMVLPEDVRFREEDPYTDLIAGVVPSRVVTHRSRFEVDLNRPVETSVYLDPDDAWGLDIWAGGRLDEALAQRSRQLAAEFYAVVDATLDPLAARGPFVVYDVHSYNHRRDGPDAPPRPQQEAPDVNVGTGSLDRAVFGEVVDAFIEALGSRSAGGRPLDVRENVAFRGRELARHVHERYPGRGCVLALEFKKTFMDEWTGRLDRDHLDQLREALSATIPPVLDAARRVGGGR